ncbi:MAG TPA: sugar MFS transporter [Cytophagaceae bacterium]
MAGISTSSSNTRTGTFDPNQNFTAPLIIVTLLFFMWGFITCMNDILIPKLQNVFDLKNWQAMLIQSAFFGAYFFISLSYFLVSITSGDPINKIGYKNGIIVGLVVAAIGCTLFFPAAEYNSYLFFLGALFILASGITILQIAANPYVAILGKPETSSSRLNLTQAFNSLGTTVAPIIGGALIFAAAAESAVSSSDTVKVPYLGLAGALILIAVMIKVAKLPKVVNEDKIEKSAGALKYPHLVLGVICIFMYVGGEVAIGSTLVKFFGLPNIAGLEEKEASIYLSFFWGGAMIGRFFGAVALAKFENNLHRLLIMAAIAAATFLVVFSVTNLELATISFGMVLLNVAMFFMGRFIPGRTLGLFAVAVMVLLLMTIYLEGQVAMWSAIGIGLFNSIMFPTIFTLAIAGLGSHTSQGSSLLVMAIVGGAIIPPLQGYVADITSIQFSFVVPLACYAYIVYYGFIGSKMKLPKEELINDSKPVLEPEGTLV